MMSWTYLLSSTNKEVKRKQIYSEQPRRYVYTKISILRGEVVFIYCYCLEIWTYVYKCKGLNYRESILFLEGSLTFVTSNMLVSLIQSCKSR
jgi:hypothetical protein